MKMTRSFAATAMLTVVAGCGASSESATTKPEPTPKPKTFDIGATIYVMSVSNGKVGSPCDPDGGVPRPGASHSGLNVGADVAVSNAAGDIIGLSKVDQGTYFETDPGNKYSSYCEVPFKVIDLPDSGQFFTVQIGDMKPQRYTRAQLDEPVTINLTD